MRISDWSSDVCYYDLHWVSNAVAILGAVESVGGDLAQAGRALAELPGLPGRGARSQVPFADGEALVIDESYNANPLSMAVTLKQLGRENGERRLAVLGAMKELGEESDAFHARSEEHTSELQSLMRISSAVFCLNKKTTHK